jgi:GDPmannose 4,6-dehydratase
MGGSLVIGVNGQDGSYLAQELLARGRTVIGVGRQPESRHVAGRPGYRYVMQDVGEHAGLGRLLEEAAPDAIYHLAAVHGPAGYVYEDKWLDALSVNVGSLQICLEAIRKTGRPCQLFYANSIKTLRPGESGAINESSPRNANCLYAITKNAAADLIEYYRVRHDVKAWCGYLCNHDSPRRAANFFLPRLVAHLAAALGHGPRVPPLNTLDFVCDWGSSQEFMCVVADLTEARHASDLVLASGVTWNGRARAQRLGNAVGLSGTDWLPIETTNKDGEEISEFKVDIARLREVWGRAPVCDGLHVAQWIARERFGLADILH